MVTNLKKLRIKNGMTQQQLANLLGISQQSVNKYENQGAEPDISTLQAIAACFHTSIDYLVGNTDIDHIIEKVEKYDLCQEEALLIDNYRLLTSSEKSSIHSVINNYVLLKK